MSGEVLEEGAENCESLFNEVFKLITPTIKEKCEMLTTVWLDVWDEEERRKRCNILANEVTSSLLEFLEAVLAREVETREKYITRIEALMEEMETLKKHLNVSINSEYAEVLPLHSIAMKLNKSIEKHRLVKNQRLQTLHEMQCQEKLLCESLGMVPNTIKFSEIPTEEELKQMSLHLKSMDDEKKHRMNLYEQKCNTIKMMFENLEVKPSLKFEKDIISDDEITDFKFSNENMSRLNNLEQNLEQQVLEAKQRALDLTDKLKNLWVYLDEPEENRKHILTTLSGYGTSTINNLLKQVEHFEAKKRENISEIIIRIRKLLVAEWDKCLISEEERNQFHFFTSDCFTEDLCELHEFEIERLRKFYQSHEHIYNLISKRQKLFDNLLDLEKRAKNSSRYYNRGGQLLQEEKERKKIKKDLPRIEEELKILLQKYEEENGKPFTAHGKPVHEIIQEQWTSHIDGKIVEKLTRKTASASKVGSNLKRPCPTSTASTSCSARKIGKFTSDKKENRGEIKKTPNHVAARRNCFKNFLDVNDPFPVQQTYEDFQSSLHAKPENVQRSTTILDICTPLRTTTLKEKNTPNNVGHYLRSVNTPAKSTPAKITTPQWTPAGIKTPKTFPRTSKHFVREMTPHLKIANQKRKDKDTPYLTTPRNKLPIII